MINHLEAAFPTGMWHYTIAMFSAETVGFGPFIGNHFREAGHTPPALTGSFEPRDISELTFTPYDLGWGKSVKFDHEFTGRAALEKAAAAPRYQRVTLEFDKRDVIDLYASLFEENAEPYEYLEIPHPSRWIIWADAVKKGDRIAGISSTPGYSYYFRRVLSLAFVDPSIAHPGTAVDVLWGSPDKRQKLIRALVAPAPYKRDTRRSNLATALTT
jgi:vanillate/3-O-methylgallate O-demethylase